MPLLPIGVLVSSIIIWGALTPWTATITYNPPQVGFTQQTAAAAPMTLQDEINEVANEYQISSTTLGNLVQSESMGSTTIDNGYDRGLVQISRKFNPDITDAQALDPMFSLRFAAQAIKDGREYIFVSCSCTQFAHVLQPAFPIQNADQVIPNASSPEVGSIAVFHYKDGEDHVAYITNVGTSTFSVREANLSPCTLDTRIVKANDPSLYGFWADPKG